MSDGNDLNKLFQGGHWMDKKNEKCGFTTMFHIAGFALLAFGVMAQLLSEMMGYTPMLADYFLHLLPSVAAGFPICFIVTKLRNSGKAGKILLVLFLVVVFAWSALMICMFGGMQFDARFQEDTYGNGWYLSWVNLKEETQYMLSKCHLFGHGDPYYQYPDELIDPEVFIIDDLSQEVQNAMMERDRVRIFRHFRWDMILPVLSYTYGFWITILFAVITAVWCISAVAAFRKLNAWWEKALYAVCGLLIAEQLILPLLGGLGIVACLIPHPFSMDWQATILTVTPQLGIMAALIPLPKIRAVDPESP